MTKDNDFTPGLSFRVLHLDAPRRLQWHAIPGMQYELDDTGFRIELLTKERKIQGYTIPASTYLLWSPEGRLLTMHMTTEPLKELGEMLAAEREELHRANGEKYQLKGGLR